MSQLSVKETKEVLDLAFLVTKNLLAEAKKDGIQWADAVKILSSQEFVQELTQAVDGWDEVSKEVKDLSFAEGVELTRYVFDKAMDLFKE